MSATCLAKTTYSLRRIFFWMILVAGLSSLVTYHIGLLLPRLEINQSVNYVDVKVRLNSMLVKEVNLEKTGIDDRRSQHPYRKLSQASDSKMQNSQLSQILAKLKQVSLIHFLTESYRRLLILKIQSPLYLTYIGKVETCQSNTHHCKQFSQAFDSKIQSSQLLQILIKLKQVSHIHVLTESYHKLLIVIYKVPSSYHNKILYNLKPVSEIYILKIICPQTF